MVPAQGPGAAWTLTEPFGEVLAATADTVLGAGFSGGASVNAAPNVHSPG